MSQSLIQIPIQLVFSIRERRPLLQDGARRSELFRYMNGICHNLGCPVIRINGPSDHVHVLCLLGRKTCVADLVRDLKSSSSKWVHGRFPDLQEFYWQKGYGAFAASHSAVPEVIRYIENQEAHHQKFSFQDEFRRMCDEYGLVIDERYVWE